MKLERLKYNDFKSEHVMEASYMQPVSLIEPLDLRWPSSDIMQGWIQEFKKGGSFKRVHAERGEKFRLTTPTFAKPRPF